MTPEEKFDRDVWWILQEIRKDEFLTLKGARVDFSVQTPLKQSKKANEGVPSADIQRKLLYKLKEWAAIDLEIKSDILLGDDFLSPATGFALTIHQPKFDELYHSYEESFKREAEKEATPATSSTSTFDWNKLSPENLKIAQKVIKITLNFLQLHPINRLSLTTKIPLQKFKSELVYLDDIVGVLNRVEGIEVINAELHYEIKKYRQTRVVPPSGITTFGNDDELPDYLPSEGELKNYVFLKISSLNKLYQAKSIINDLLGTLDFEKSDKNIKDAKSQPNERILTGANKKKLCILEKLKEEHDLTPKTAVRTHVYFGYSHVRPAGEAWLYGQKLLAWIQECNLNDRLELENILAIFQQEGLISKFIFSEQEGNLKIQFPEEFEERYNEYRKTKKVVLPPRLSDDFEATRKAHTSALKKELEKESLIEEIISRVPNNKFGSNENPLHIVISDVKKDIRIRGFEEKVVLQKPKNKKIQLRNFPSDLRWEEISIQFLNEHEVIIKARNETLQTTYEAMGFQDDKRKLPNKQWQFLRLLSLKNGEISWESNQNLPLKQINSIKKQKQLLTEALKAYFQISNDEPFHDYKTEKAYRIKLTLTPEPELKDMDEREVYDE